MADLALFAGSRKKMRVISGYFGVKITGVYEAPLPRRSYFFSNNIALKEVAQSKG